MNSRRDSRRVVRHCTGRLLLVTAVAALSACNPGAEEARSLDASCSDGDAAACYSLAYKVQQGEHVLRDWRRAADLFQLACDGREAEGCVRLGRMHVHGAAESRGVTSRRRRVKAGNWQDRNAACQTPRTSAAYDAVDGAPTGI